MAPEGRRQLRRGLVDVDRWATRRDDELHRVMFGLSQTTRELALALLGRIRIGNRNEQSGSATGHAHSRISCIGYRTTQATKFWSDPLGRMLQFVAEPYAHSSIPVVGDRNLRDGSVAATATPLACVVFVHLDRAAAIRRHQQHEMARQWLGML